MFSEFCTKAKVEGVTLQEKKEPLKLEKLLTIFLTVKKISDSADLLESIIDNEVLPF